MDHKITTRISTLMGSFLYFSDACDAALESGQRPKPTQSYNRDALAWALEELAELYPAETEEAEKMTELRRSGRRNY
jgi:hypothetical protein